ncbi:MAG: hypothetical protein ISR48_01835 [Alphaproteobacteria bacterium]|nr:hypothetical protein [Alphaproteobacteria bacterium]
MAKRKVVGHFSKEARKDRRYEFPLRVTIAGTQYTTLDWGFGGFRVTGYEGDLRRDNEFMVTCIAGPTSEGTTVRALAVVVHFSLEAKELSCSFLDLDDAAFDELNKAVTRRLK